MSFDPALKAALTAPVANLVCGIEIVHPYKTIRLIDGLGFVSFEGNAYVGNDPDIGSLGGVDVTGDGTGEEAPSLGIVLHQVNSAVAVELCKPNAQGAAVRLWLGAFDPATGALIGTPYIWFVGEVDVPTLNMGGSDASVSFECVSGFERFFDTDEGMRMSDSFLQSVWPGDLGFQYITDTPQTIPWGKDGSRPQLTGGLPVVR